MYIYFYFCIFYTVSFCLNRFYVFHLFYPFYYLLINLKFIKNKKYFIRILSNNIHLRIFFTLHQRVPFIFPLHQVFSRIPVIFHIYFSVFHTYVIKIFHVYCMYCMYFAISQFSYNIFLKKIKIFYVYCTYCMYFAMFSIFLYRKSTQKYCTVFKK